MTRGVVFARVSTAPIAVADCVAAVSAAEHGAVVTFAGIVRDHDEGRSVTTLDYEAHPTAQQVIASVAAAVADSFPGVAIAVEHRVGSLVVGELALAAAVGAAHRADAFAACARLIDEVKASVPIWKEQRFGDGSSEWVGSLG
jgi:molybdopterin synthase catalytic subunit